MTAYGKRRDANEPLIVDALRAVGAFVQPLNEKGVPDLLVGYQGRTFLLEVKQAHGQMGARMRKTKSGLRETQERWWAEWKGAPPVAVTTVDEALVAIGVLTPFDRLAKVIETASNKGPR